MGSNTLPEATDATPVGAVLLPSPIEPLMSTDPSAARCPAAADYSAVLSTDRAGYDAYDLVSLQSDVQAVDASARADPDFAGLEVTSDKPVKLVVSMRGDLEAHTAALQAVVEHHDRLEVFAPKYSTDQINAIVNQIVTDAQAHPDDFTQFSGGPGSPQQVVAFGLAPGEEKLAQAYVERWGDAVRISVGFTSFVPPGCGIQPLSRKCPDLNGVDAASADLALALTETTPTIEQRGWGMSTLTVTNEGTKPFTMDVGAPLSGVLVIPGTVHVVGVVGGTKGTGLGINVAGGESTSINVAFAAFRCDGETGSAAPPGSYGLRVVLASEEQGDTRAYLSPEVPVTVTTNSD